MQLALAIDLAQLVAKMRKGSQVLRVFAIETVHEIFKREDRREEPRHICEDVAPRAWRQEKEMN